MTAKRKSKPKRRRQPREWWVVLDIVGNPAIFHGPLKASQHAGEADEVIRVREVPR